MVHCSVCGCPFERRNPGCPAAAIAVEVMGDEYIESFFFCEACGVYTQETYHDRFLGEDSVSVSGPIAKAVGDALVESIGRCPDPMNKKCDCPSHQRFL